MKIRHLSLFMMLCFGLNRSSSEILQRQKRNWIIDSFSIDEGYKGTYPYSLGTIKVEKSLTLFKIEGQGVDVEPKGILEINESTGEITVHGPVDYEKYTVLKLKFQALDKFSRLVDTKLGIEIKITDVNDNAPTFDQEWYQITIDESAKQGTDLITIQASDKDSNSQNSKIQLKVVSVNPKPHDLEFYLIPRSDGAIGTISFAGCLDHEKAEKYTIIVEAKDNGQPVQLSSSCTVIVNIKDGNNHLPVITRQTGPGRVKELQENVLVARLQVTDEDTKGTEAWRAKFQIQGDTNKNFRITTDPDTNEGLLYVEKHLDYEDGSLKNVTITVENEIPYYSCKVQSRSSSSSSSSASASGLWKVSYTGGATGATMTALSLSTYHMTVIVEDVNDSPVFDEPNKAVKLKENVKAGQWLAEFTAKDPDITSANTVKYIKGDDPADWVTVDPKSGNITLSKTLDRESHFVKNNIYVTTVCAVDNGEPPMTSTATLSIHIIDENDNTPSLNKSTIDMCQSNGSSWTSITAVDLDDEPYGGPFNFKLHGDVEGKWKVDPVHGYSVNLVKENTIHSGYYKLLLEVSDRQGYSAIHNLTITVCSCLDAARPNCRLRRSASAAGGPVLGVILLGILLLAGMLLLALLLSCKKDLVAIPDDSSGQHLMKCNTEGLGSDCKVAIDSLYHGHGNKAEQIKISCQALMKPPPTATVSIARDITGYGMSHTDIQSRHYLQRLVSDSVTDRSFTRRDSSRWSMGASSAARSGHEHRNVVFKVSKNLMGQNWMEHSKYSHQMNSLLQHELLLLINKKLYMLQAPGVELDDYGPHVYADEGDTENNSDFDVISIPDVSFNLDFSQDLDFKFNTLASICMPSENTASSEKDSCPTNFPSTKP